MRVLGYKFDSEFYADTEAGKQSLLEAVLDAVTTEAATDPELTGNDLGQQRVIDATFENTLVEGSPWGTMTFWENCKAMNRDSYYLLNIERVTDESDPAMVAECKEWLYMD